MSPHCIPPNSPPSLPPCPSTVSPTSPHFFPISQLPPQHPPTIFPFIPSLHTPQAPTLPFPPHPRLTPPGPEQSAPSWSPRTAHRLVSRSRQRPPVSTEWARPYSARSPRAPARSPALTSFLCPSLIPQQPTRASPWFCPAPCSPPNPPHPAWCAFSSGLHQGPHHRKAIPGHPSKMPLFPSLNFPSSSPEAQDCPAAVFPGGGSELGTQVPDRYLLNPQPSE